MKISVPVRLLWGMFLCFAASPFLQAQPIALHLGPDTTLCPGSILLLSAPSNPNFDYSWSTGASTSSIIVNASGIYAVTVSSPQDTVSDAIVVSVSNLNAVLNVSDSTICAQTPVTFDITGAGVPIGSSVTFNSGFGPPITNPVWPLTTPGYVANPPSLAIYTAVVTIVDPFGCTDSATRTIRVEPLPNVTLSANADSLCEGNSVTFTRTVQGALQAASYQVDFLGNQLYQNIQAGTFNYTYSNPGQSLQTFVPIIIVTNPNYGCADTASTGPIVIKPRANVSFLGDSVCFPNAVSLVNQSESAVGAQFLWSMGDGFTQGPMFAGNLDYIYATNNTLSNYTVTLTISQFGCSASAISPALVYQTPSVTLEATDSLCGGNAATFTLFPSDVGQFFTYTLNFGDNNTATGTQNQLGQQHGYPAIPLSDAIYTAAVELINGIGGCSAEDSIEIVVWRAPAAQISVSPVCAGTPTTIVNLSNYDPGQTTLTWDLGVAGLPPFTGDFPSYLYTFPGNDTTYGVQLLLTDPVTGCSNVAQATAVLRLQPAAQFAAEDTCSGTPAQIVNLSSGTSFNIIYSLDLGDGSILSLGNTFNAQNYVYAQGGSYLVTLIANNNNSCSDTISGQINIFTPATIALSYAQNEFCIGDPAVTLSANLPGGVFSGINVFDDPALGDALGTFDPVQIGSPIVVSYTYRDNNNCLVVESDNFIVHPLPVLSLSGLQPAYCHQDPLDILFANVPGGVFTSTLGNTLSDPDPTDATILFTPATVGTATLTYAYVDNFGCANAIDTTTIISELPPVQLPTLAYLSANSPTTTLIPIGGGQGASLFDFIWSTNQSDSFIVVDEPGIYVVSVTNQLTGCVQLDTTLVLYALGVEQPGNDIEGDWIVYPNPVRSTIFIKNKESKDVLSASLRDYLGREYFLKSELDYHELHYEMPEGLNTGVYFLKITTLNGKIVSRKIIYMSQ